jgi:hypothetical protein
MSLISEALDLLESRLMAVKHRNFLVVAKWGAHPDDPPMCAVYKIYRLLREEYPLAIPNYNGRPCAPVRNIDQMLFGLFEEPESQWEDIVATDDDGNWIGCEPHL